MSSFSVPTKSGVVDPYAPSSSSPAATPRGPFSLYHRFAQWRANLALPYPGNVENITKEVKSTHLTNFFFDGARADLTKSMSMNPLFQVTHSFHLGSQTAPSSYNFGAVFANEKIFLQGGVDHDGNVSARLNQGWTPGNISKLQAQVSATPGHNFLQAEQDYQGADYNLNVKALNPWPSDLTGIFVGSYLQSVTKNLALGTECMLNHVTPGSAELAASYLAKLTGTDKNWIATANLQPAGILQTTYWQKLSDKVEAAADLTVIASPIRRDAVATLGAKYDLRMSSFKAQLDSTGKVSALLEQRFTPTFSFTLSGEIDHFKNAAKVGFGVMIESTSLTQEEMEAQMPMPPPS